MAFLSPTLTKTTLKTLQYISKQTVSAGVSRQHSSWLLPVLYFFLRIVYPKLRRSQLLSVFFAWKLYLAYEIESRTRTPKEVKELGFLPTLKNWIFSTLSVLFYTAFGIPECITLFCWSIFQRNFNFRNWLLFNKISVEQLNPGDHIYTWRGYAYTHHGIYAGDRKVIHAVRGRGSKRSSSASSSSSPCYSPNIYAESIDIDKFLSGGELYVYEYGVNLGYFIAKFRGGACTLASSDPTEDVLGRANFLLSHNSREDKKRKKGKKRNKGMKRSKSKVIVGAYNLFNSNCEDFAIYCKTGLVVCYLFVLGRSGQIACLFAVLGFVISFSIPFLTGDLIRVVAGYCIYSAFRIISDTKWLRDICRIPVEESADFGILVDGIFPWKHFHLLINVLQSTIFLWNMWCASTECHICQHFRWITVGIAILPVFF